MTASRLLAAAAIGICMASSQGCGDGMPQRVPLSGTVTFDGGPCPGPGTVFFTPDGSGAIDEPMRPATAEFGVDGRFTAGTFDAKDGLLPGRYKISIQCWETPPNMEGKPVKSFIDNKYQNGATSGFELTVELGQAPPPLELKVVSKPAAVAD